MRSVFTRLGGLVALTCCLLAQPAVSTAQPFRGDVTAEFQSQGAHAGLWKYCFVFDYASEGPLEEITIDFWYLKVCAEGVGCGDHWQFDQVAGQVYGANGCNLNLTGSLDCKGDELIGSPGPLLRFAATPVEDCSPDYVGKGSLCFYSEFGPMQDSRPAGSPREDTMAIYAKSGEFNHVAYFSGPRPNACATSAKAGTWGGLKLQYR